MKSTKEEEKRNSRTGMVVSVAVHAVLLLLLFFIIAWRMPDPPRKGNAEGVMIDIGFTAAGTQSNTEEVTEVEQEEIPEEIVEESVVDQQKLVTTDLESPQKIKKAEDQKEVKKEKQQQETPKKEVPNPNNLFPGEGKDKKGKDKDKGGDNPGGGGGGLLNLPGWKFDYVPNDPDPSNESGYVIIKFEIDENGKVISAKSIDSRGLSFTTIDHYKKKILASRFIPENSDLIPDKGAVGSYRFNIKMK